MKKALSSIVISLISAQAFAAPITISCYRGPWKEVIWDRPNPIFIDTLMENGYSIVTASSIAHRICRDPGLVGRLGDGSAVAVLKRILRETPKDGN